MIDQPGIGTLARGRPTKEPSGGKKPRSHLVAIDWLAVPLWASLMFFSLLISAAQHCQCLGPLRSSSSSASLVPLEPGIFNSALGGEYSNRPPQNYNSNNGNSAAQLQLRQLKLQQAHQQQSAAELQHQSYKNGQTSDKVTLPGDILLGGLFPIHMKGKWSIGSQ